MNTNLYIYIAYHTRGKDFGTATSLYVSDTQDDKSYRFVNRVHTDRTYLAATLTSITDMIRKLKKV